MNNPGICSSMQTIYQTITKANFCTQLADYAEFTRIELRSADLSQTEAYQMSLQACLFVDVDFSDINWERLNAVSCKFINCNFRGLPLTPASSKGALSLMLKHPRAVCSPGRSCEPQAFPGVTSQTAISRKPISSRLPSRIHWPWVPSSFAPISMRLPR